MELPFVARPKTVGGWQHMGYESPHWSPSPHDPPARDLRLGTPIATREVSRDLCSTTAFRV
jgi:hypothetical protein